MLEDGDIYRVVVNQRHIPSGKQIVNRFHFMATEVVGLIAAPEDFAQIAAEVLIGMHTVVSPYQSDDISYDGATFENLTNGIDIGSYSPPTALVGADPSPPEPLYVALSFKLVRATRLTRNGSKRFGGIGDANLTTNDGSNLAGTVGITAIEDWLATPAEVVVGTGLDFVSIPTIVRIPALGGPPTVFTAVASSEYRGAGSQNSRKQLL